MSSRPTLVTLLGLILIAARAEGQGPGSKVGEVVVSRDGRHLTLEDGEVVPEPGLRGYTVDRVEGEMLRVVAEGKAAWVGAGEVVALDRAAESYGEEIRRDPRNRAAYRWRGQIRVEREEYDRAIADDPEAIKLDPADFKAFVNRGSAREAKDEPDEAIADYSEAITLDPKDAAASFGRGVCWSEEEAYGKAIADFDRAIAIDPESAPAYRERGIARRNVGADAEASADLDMAIRLAPYGAAGFKARAWIWATCPDAKYRDGKKAVEAATMASELNGPENPLPHATLAAAYAEAGDFARAVACQGRANLLDRTAEEEAEGEARLALDKGGAAYRSPR